jgi:hypothetical protein
LRRDGWWGAGEQNNHLRMGSPEKGSEATLSVCQLFPLVFWSLFLFLPSQHNGLVLLTLKTHSKSVINSYAVQNHHNHTANSVPKPRNAHLCWVQNQCIQTSSLQLLFQPSEVNPILNNVVCLRLSGYYRDWVATSVGQLSLLQRNNQQVKVVAYMEPWTVVLRKSKEPFSPWNHSSNEIKEPIKEHTLNCQFFAFFRKLSGSLKLCKRNQELTVIWFWTFFFPKPKTRGSLIFEIFQKPRTGGYNKIKERPNNGRYLVLTQIGIGSSTHLYSCHG